MFTQIEIGNRYGVCSTTISDVVNKVTWKRRN